jgi:hypothetical protein
MEVMEEEYYEVQYYQRRGKRKDAKSVYQADYAETFRGAVVTAYEIRDSPLVDGSVKVVKCEVLLEIGKVPTLIVNAEK